MTNVEAKNVVVKLKIIGMLLIILLTLSACSSAKPNNTEAKENTSANVTINGKTYENIQLQKEWVDVTKEEIFELKSEIPKKTLVPIRIKSYLLEKGSTHSFALKIGDKVIISPSVEIEEVEESKSVEQKE